MRSRRPLSLSSTICFEQSYDGVDGDSASSTELYAILSSLPKCRFSRVSLSPVQSIKTARCKRSAASIKRSKATIDVCRLKGLTGEQGAMIPQANLRNLMLRPDVVEAVKAEQVSYLRCQ